MRPALLSFGVLLILIGAALYFVPPLFAGDRAAARTVADLGGLATWGLPVMGIGAILALLGLVIPDPRTRVIIDDNRVAGDVVREVTTRRTRNARGRVVREEKTEVIRDTE